MTRVLHVTECFAGGVKRAIEARVTATEELEHHLLYSGEEDVSPLTPWASVHPMPKNPLRAIAGVREAVRRLEPDVVHAHSSWAGFYARLLKLPAPVVYEPHCFKFDDPSSPGLARWVFHSAERLLAPRTAAFATLSTYEGRLTESVAPGARSVRLENTPSIASVSPQASSSRTRHSVVMVGRLAKQKDPEYFLRTVREVRRLDSRLHAVWVGDGEEHYRRMLEKEGIEVTGWLSGDEVRERLVDSVYVHTAAYEGLPLSILDAAAADAPITARGILSLTDLPIHLESTPETLAESACLLSVPGERQDAALRGNARIRRTYNMEKLGESLAQLYRQAQ